MFCKKCGKQIDDDSVFCSFCGMNLKTVELARDNMQTEKQKEISHTDKMIDFSDKKNNYYKVNFPVNDKYVGISESLEKYTLIHNKFKDLMDLCGGHFRKFYDESIKNIDDVIKKAPDFFEDELSDVISGAVALLVNLGVIEYSENNLIDQYFKNFDYSQYFDEAIKAYNKVYQFEEWVEQYRGAQRGARSKWVGGGFGISGAIKGAVTAGVMNSGMGVLRNIKDQHIDIKDNDRFIRLKKEVLTVYPIKDRLYQGMKECCSGVFDAVIDILSEYDVLKKIVIDEAKANAIFENTMAYEENAENFNKQLMRCIELNPFDGRYYAALTTSYGDQELHIQNLANYFGCDGLVNQIKYQTFDDFKEENHDIEEILELAKFLGLEYEVQQITKLQNIKKEKLLSLTNPSVPKPSDLGILHTLLDKTIEEQIQYVQTQVNKYEIDKLFKTLEMKKLWDLVLSCDIYAIYVFEEYLEKNIDRGFMKEFERLAGQGYKSAEFMIYRCMYSCKKYFLYQKDAEKDMIKLADRTELMSAWAHAGYLLYAGKNITPDYPRAYHFLSRAAQSFHPIALFWLGQMYKYGHYVSENQAMAKLCTVCASALGCKLAREEL